ncbi:rhomboid family intramembrane serine protease [bacterium]|nr:rhomboid family intramembrane serine protease [bacterium]
MIPLHDDNPTQSTPVLTIGLIGLNVAVFLYQALLPGREMLWGFYAQFAVVPAEITGVGGAGAYGTLISSMFLHGGVMHLAGNMLYLWIFGNNIEDTLGRARFIAFYVLSGAAASAAHILTNPDSTVPCIGASGAISGVLGAYLLLFPRARVLALVPLGIYTRMMRVPAWLLLLVWFGMQLASGWSTAGGDEGGVAWWAHIGGFIAGMALLPMLKPRTR